MVSEFPLMGKERIVPEGGMVSLGGKLPYRVECRTSTLLNLVMSIVKIPSDISLKAARRKARTWFYARTRPGFYLEAANSIHIAYAAQCDGHGTEHYWRVFYNADSADLVASKIPGTVTQQAQPVHPEAKMAEWGGLYFRSEAEIALAKGLNQRELLFFANARGRISTTGCEVSKEEASGRLELDFIVFYRGQAFSVEVDGNQHAAASAAARDYTRDRLLLKEGLPTIRFSARDCLNNTDNVVSELCLIMEGMVG